MYVATPSGVMSEGTSRSVMSAVILTISNLFHLDLHCLQRYLFRSVYENIKICKLFLQSLSIMNLDLVKY